jgi:uncharacterized protein (TIGR03067 family)
VNKPLVQPRLEQEPKGFKMTSVQPDIEQDEDRKRLQAGKWAQVSVEADGNAGQSDELSGPDIVVTFSDDRFYVAGRDAVLLLEGAYALDASTSPKSIDWIDSIGPDKGKLLLAIYELDGDHFRFIAADDGAPRPTAFSSGPGLTMRAFVRRNSAA